MYQLPESSNINKALPKKAIFDKFDLKTAQRNVIDDDISRMSIANFISPQTIPALKEGAQVKGFYLVTIALKRKEYDAGTLQLLTKLIPQHMVFALQYESETQMAAVYNGKVLQADWAADKDITIALQGLDLDAVWENLLGSIGNFDTTEAKSLGDQIAEKEQREKLMREIAALEKKLRSSSQTRQKYQIHKKILQLRNELKDL
jgi:hypothetical protein